MPPTTEPSLADALVVALAAGQAKIKTATVGRVTTYDRDTRTAEVFPVNDTAYQRPGEPVQFEPALPIANVPVLFQLWTFDLAVGAFVLVIFVERSLDEWRSQGGSGHRPINRRMHAPTDAFAIPLVYAPGGAQPEDAVAAGAAVAKHDDIRLGGASASFFVALSNLVDARIAAVVAGHNAHTHTAGTGPTSTPNTPIADQDTVACTTTKAL